MNTIDHFVTPEELMAFRDGELPFERAAAIRAHVLACPECQRLNATLESVSNDLARWRVAPAPASLTAPPISSGVRSAGPRTLRWRPRRLVWALGIAGGCGSGGAAGHAALAPLSPPPLRRSRSVVVQPTIRWVNGSVAAQALKGWPRRPGPRRR